MDLWDHVLDNWKSRMLYTKTKLKALLSKLKVKVKEVKEVDEDKNSLQNRFETVESELIKAQEDRDQDSEIKDLR